jgi:KipI family sensor histidine kinase inhibitor
MPTSQGVRFLPASDRALLISFGEQIGQDSYERIAKLLHVLELEPIPGVRDFHPAYSSLLVIFDALKVAHPELEAVLRGYLERTEQLRLPEPRKVEIPVCYCGEYGPDLQDVAALRGITTDRVIELHSSAEYVVYFLGFVPGFAYLGELADELVTPRLATPRRSVPPGSVGIAGRQTGVYPLATPGGWRLIGRTALAMFRPDSGSRLAIGDRVRFVSISSQEFAALEKEQAKV